MNQYQKQLVDFVNYALEFKNIDIEENLNFEEIFKEAKEHQIEGLIYYSIKKLGLNNQLKEEFFKDVKNNIFLSSVYNIRQDFNLKNLFEKIKNENLDIIFLKGSIIKDLYPKPELRTMGDYDVLVKDTDLKRAKLFFENLGYVEKKEDHEHELHIAYCKDHYRNIEVHWKLINERFINNSSNFESNVWNNCKLVADNSKNIYTLSHEDMVIYLVYHMAVHMVCGGFGLRQLMDLAIYSEKYKTQINWSNVKEIARENNIEMFLDYLFGACNKLFSIDIPIEVIYNNENIIDGLLENIFKSGVFGRKDKGEQFARTLSSEGDVTSDAEKNFMKIIFPKIDNMSETYNYAKKNKILAPVAWGHHVVRGVCNKNFSVKNKVDFMLKSVKVAKKRDAFFKELGLK